jgi:hypothetical protein
MAMGSAKGRRRKSPEAQSPVMGHAAEMKGILKIQGSDVRKEDSSLR